MSGEHQVIGITIPELMWSKYDSTIFCLGGYPLPDDKYTVWTKLFGRTISTYDLASTNHSSKKSDVHALLRIIIGLNRIIVHKIYLNRPFSVHKIEKNRIIEWLMINSLS